MVMPPITYFSLNEYESGFMHKFAKERAWK